MKHLLAIALAILTSAAGHAGTANDDIRCRSADGRLAFAGSIPGDEAEFDAAVRYDGRSARLYSVLNQSTLQTEENARLDTVEDLENGVWTLKSRRNDGDHYGYLQMYALPKTVSFRRVPHGFTASFRAKLSVSQPELGGVTRSGTVRCELRYQL